MTKLTLKNANIIGQSNGFGLYEITLECRTKDVSGQILEATHLNVEIKSIED